MNLNRSAMKNSRYDKIVEQMELKVIDQSLQRSYIFQVAPKTIKKPKSTQLQLRQSNRKQQQSLLRTSSLYKSFLHTKTKATSYRVLMSQIKPKKTKMNCCGGDGKTMVLVRLDQFREMEVRGADKDNYQQVLYNVNFNTVWGKVREAGIGDSGGFILDVSDKIVLMFESLNKQEDNTAFKLKQALQAMIADSLGVEFQMNKICSFQNFHKNAYKSCTEFAENCQTGDILLFRGNLFWAKLQRFVSNSEYDHVGMLYKDPIHGILIFQATSASGICLTPWEFVIKYKWYQFIDRIAWRKLQGVQRTQQFLEKMRQYIIEKVGKAYHISLDKLMSNESVIYSRSLPTISQQPAQIPEQLNQQPKLVHKETSQTSKSDNVGYFCSQLVAKMYKQIGVLISDKQDKNFKPSCNFYPYHFTQKFDIKMVGKASLSKQYTICFDENQIKSFYGDSKDAESK